MKRHLLKTMVALLAMAASAIAPAWGQSYNVTFSGFFNSNVNITHEDQTLPHQFTFGKADIASDISAIKRSEVTTSAGKDEIQLSNNDDNLFINVTAAFEGTATINVKYWDGEDNVRNINVTVSCMAAAPPQPHTVRLAEGTEEAANWTLASGDASVPGTQVLENVMSGSQVTATYNGTTKKVKSVKAVKYVPPAATVTTAPTATAAIIEVGSTAALVNAGAANGGSMMYAVTTTNAQPASTADFSATIPTAQGRTAGTYYVWYYAKADAEHSDSEIAGPVSVTLPVITTVTWNSTTVFNSAHRDDMILNTEWDSNPLTYEGVTISMSAFSEESVSSFNAYNEHDQAGGLTCFGEDGDSFTFTAPSGKMFCKIEIIDNSNITFTNYGDWTQQADNKVVWSGTAANTVTLGTVYTSAHLNSIVFKLIDAQ